jgi:hypothetical protein
LELEYLKNEVLPQTALFIRNKVADLCCQIDFSFQYDEEKNIDYSFCSSNSEMLFRDKLEYKSKSDVESLFVSSNQVKEQDLQQIVIPTNSKIVEPQREEKQITKLNGDEVKGRSVVHNKLDVRIVKYTDKSFVLYGDTRLYADELRKIKGVFNYYLKEGPGWIFSSKKEVAVRIALKNVLPEEPCVFVENKMPIEKKPVKPYKLSGETLNVGHEGDMTEEEDSDSEKSFSASRLFVEYKGFDSVEKYLMAFSKMRTVVLKGIRGPQKAILLLSIFKGVKEGWIKNNRIHISPELINAYFDLWDKYVPLNWPFACNARQPYIHLASDGFYHLNLIKKISDINIAWSVPDITRHCSFAYLDENLYKYINNEFLRQEMEEFLIDTYITKQL